MWVYFYLFCMGFILIKSKHSWLSSIWPNSQTLLLWILLLLQLDIRWTISFYHPRFHNLFHIFYLITFLAIIDHFFKSILGDLFDLPIHILILMKMFSICRSFDSFFFESAGSFFMESNSFLILLILKKMLLYFKHTYFIVSIALFSIISGPWWINHLL